MARAKDQLPFASTPAPNSIDAHSGQDIRPLSRPPATTSVPNGDSAQRMLEVSSGPSVPMQNGEKPDCKCGCDCGKKLELLIHAIEARIGQPLASSSELNIHSDDDPSEWVENVLGPLPPAIRSTATTTSSGGSSTSLSWSSSSVADVPELDDSGFSAGVIPPLPTTAISSSCCTVKADPTPRAPSAPKSSCCSSQPTGNPPAQITQVQAVATDSCCSSTSLPVLPQQETIVEQDSCCEPTLSTDKLPRQAASSCCGGSKNGGEKEKCSCCSKKRKRGWQPGDPQNPMIDDDGALACSCGCYKPFEECTNCFEDLCESVLLKPN
ncbi:hypothetical protein DL89DRAFT_262906 [Linderina pennispora]|uniref:Uncharacterized protein n=1 Tax=Linderina pennispora TaxID=61395 RepID=A0A1Y1VSF5_9FUNG|nr:uncharacterized protein DL89DRAFT_262906 [Linderina pennispora]ORX63946.1 hypothetical protein DL89DRAFT_262906 [Linderina pennispora]